MILRSGVDIVEIQRLDEVNPAIRARFIRRVFTENEVELARGSSASLAGRFAADDATGVNSVLPPVTTALGALLQHITGGHISVDGADDGAPRSFQPMNINYGLLPELDAVPVNDEAGKKLKGPERGRAKKRAMSRRALADLDRWLEQGRRAAAE